MDDPSIRSPEGEEKEAARSSAPARPIGQAWVRGLIEKTLRRQALWAVVAVAGLLGLTWKGPSGDQLGVLVEGRIAPATVAAPFDIETPDEVRTAERREQARRAIDDVYVFDARAAERLEDELQEGLGPSMLPGPPDPAFQDSLRGPRGREVMASIRRIVRTILSEKIVARTDTLPVGRAIAVRYFGSQTELSMRDLSRVIDLEEAKRKVREAAAGIHGLEPENVVLVGDWMASLIQPNLTYDLRETRRRMEEASQQVPVLYSRIPKGTVLVRKGSPLTRDAIREIEAVRQASPRGFDLTAQMGMLLLIIFLAFFLWRYASDLQRDHRRVRHLFPFLTITLVLHAALARAGRGLIELITANLEFPFDRPESFWYLIPAASGAVLVTLLAHPRIATVYSLFASAVFAILFDWNGYYTLFVLLAQLAGIYGLTQYRARAALLRAGFGIGLTGASVVAALDAIASGFQPWQVCGLEVAFAFLGGMIGVPLLVAFLLPIFEWLFGVLTDIRLLELSNLDNPLLSELALRAPGSYNHSIVVGSLAEAAAEAIGANALFCRVAAYYHDIGKMKMPEYYIENQRPRENPHDRLAPSMSALIIANHVKEGIRLGREHGLPEPILDIIPQHHGTRVMTYFYEKAKAAAAESGQPPPNPDDFRHPGPKPKTKEAAIFMLSDSVEAAARTLDELTDERFRDVIRQIASRVILDGQFDQCDLTFLDLDKIMDAFVRTLGSIHHHRIDYPTFIFEGASGARRTSRATREAVKKSGEESAG